jgi:hypothetical protein
MARKEGGQFDAMLFQFIDTEGVGVDTPDPTRKADKRGRSS